MVRAGLLAGLFLFAVGVVLMVTAQIAGAHHTGVPCGPTSNPGRAVCLLYADSSYAVTKIQQQKHLTYCFDQRATNYPNFVSQVESVNANQGSAIGVQWIRISGVYTTSSQAKFAGCDVWHSMPDVHGCSECGAWVHYLNNPVTIEYRWQVGYNDWRTTIAHEQVHIYGLHEHYDDVNFRSYRNNFGRWAHGLFGDPGTANDAVTVMDSGVGVFLGGDWLTDYDLRHVCMNIDPRSQYFVGCGYIEQQEPCEPCWVTRIEWNGQYRWRFDNSRSFTPDAGCGLWYNAANQLVMGACDNSWNGRYVKAGSGDNAGVWLHRGSSVFTFNEWWEVP